MAVTLENTIERFRGLSTDTKPGLFPETVGGTAQRPREGSVFHEIDTGRRFIYHAGGWVKQPQTIEALLVETIDLQVQILAALRATHRGHELYQWKSLVDEDE
jgi:hypothetical protein